jgi:hypothetical protein
MEFLDWKKKKFIFKTGSNIDFGGEYIVQTLGVICYILKAA